MLKRLLCAQLSVLAALALLAAAAQAEPHWRKGGSLLTATHVVVASKGALTSEPLPAQVVTCKLKDSEEIWNPVGGGAGEDLMSTFTLAPCSSTPACKKWVYQLNVPRPSYLLGTGPIVDVLVEPDVLKVSCAGKPIEEWIGVLAPAVGNGTLNFNGGSGSTLNPVGSGSQLHFTGVDKMKAPPGKITATNP